MPPTLFARRLDTTAAMVSTSLRLGYRTANVAMAEASQSPP